MLTKTLRETKKKQRASLIKAMNNDIGSIDSAKDSWNPAQISERAKDISYIRSLVDSWNPAQLNEALKMLDLPIIDTWNPAQIEEQRRNLVFYLAERTLTGNPITLNILGNLTPEVTGLKVTMNPIQDLHGYPNPWAGGAEKNKLPFDLAQIKTNNTNGTWTENVYVYNGVTFTINDDGSVDVSGVPTSDYVVFMYSDFAGIDGEFKFNGCPAGGSSSSNYKMDMLYNPNTGETIADDVGQGSGVFELNSSRNYRARIIIYNSKPSGTIIFKPMVRLSTVTDATFSPYSNICPISGRTEVSVTRTAGEDVETKTHEYNETIWWGEDDFKNGGMEAIGAEIASYDGETLSGEWMSDRDVYSPDTTPTTGAQVVYKNTPNTIETTPEEITLLKGTNVLSTDGDSIELKYKQNF